MRKLNNLNNEKKQRQSDILNNSPSILPKQENMFYMYPKGNVYFQQFVKVSFLPQVQEQSISLAQQDNKQYKAVSTITSEVGRKLSILPIFNQDNRYYTSCFINPYESEESDEEMRHYHEQKVIESHRQVQCQSIMIPKPRSKNRYCAVCRNNYSDYLEHIQSSPHKRNVKRSPFSTDIKQLENIFSMKLNKSMIREINHKMVLTRSAAKRRLQELSRVWVDSETDAKDHRKNSNKFDGSRYENEGSEAQVHNGKREPQETTVKSSLLFD